jgi:hypothetical protein
MMNKYFSPEVTYYVYQYTYVVHRTATSMYINILYREKGMNY